MYAYLRGTIIDIAPDHTILEVEGIGYMIYTPLHFFTNTPQKGKKFFYIHHCGNEDFFGFEKKKKDLFEKLITISGLGPKTAMAIIGRGDTLDLPAVILEKDSIALTKVPGIGKKTAERIIIELSDKVQGLAEKARPVSPIAADATAALMSLGYKEKEAISSVKKALDKSPAAITLSELIALSLSRK